MPWYTAPAALAILNAITERPAVVWSECALSGDMLPSYEIPAELEAMHSAAIKAMLDAKAFGPALDATIDASPLMIMHALFGSAGWYAESNFGSMWPAIRDDIALALLPVAA